MAIDSLEKVKFYTDAISLGQENSPRFFGVSRLFWRDYHCFPNCGACCRSSAPFSIDFLPEEFEKFSSFYPEYISFFDLRVVNFYGRDVAFYSNYPFLAKNFTQYSGINFCQFLANEALCGIHFNNPFSCRFELNKTLFRKKENKVYLTKKLFGRKWAMRKIDGTRGTLCSIDDVSIETVKKVYERDFPLIIWLKDFLDSIGVENRGGLLLEILENQKSILLQGFEIPPITLIKERMLF